MAEREQETSFGGMSQRIEVLKEHLNALYQMLSERSIYQTPEVFHFDYFELRDEKLYYRDKRTQENKGGELRSVGAIAETLGKEGLCDLGSDIPIEGKVTARQAIMLNKVEEELPSTSDLAKVDNIELQEMTENTVRSTDDLIAQLEGSEDLPMHELQGLDIQLRNIRRSLKVEVAKRLSYSNASSKKSVSL